MQGGGLSIKPPRRPSQANTIPTQSSIQRRESAFNPSASYSAHQSGRPPSPVAPQASPLTPHARPAFPVPSVYSSPGAIDDALNGSDTSMHASEQDGGLPRTAQYIHQPPPLPFSGQEATDAIALRAAISTLQFQKKKAEDDIRMLEQIKKMALADPALFKSELAAGRLKEQRPSARSLQDLLDQPDSDEDVEEATMGAVDDRQISPGAPQASASGRPAEVPDSHATVSATTSRPGSGGGSAEKPAFPQIPGPQNVVRMPHINWEKYHILGEPLDRMHRQQQMWPGMPYGQERGRGNVVAAPYSPFQDVLYDQQGATQSRQPSSMTRYSSAEEGRKDSGPVSISEHPMETRRSSKYQQN